MHIGTSASEGCARPIFDSGLSRLRSAHEANSDLQTRPLPHRKELRDHEVSALPTRSAVVLLGLVTSAEVISVTLLLSVHNLLEH